ncbi:MAG: hypothetical protein ACXACD_13855 [Candidatus Thorarchaeota archaeon]|jgi:hypothetical protein
MTGQERPIDETSSDELASELIDAVGEDQNEDDALTKRERKVEKEKEEERIRKAKELKKQLRRKELGLLQYRWPAIVLLLTGILSIWTEFSDVMYHDPGMGFDTFWGVFVNGSGTLQAFNIFFIFPLISGSILVVLAYFAYSNPKATFLSVFPALMMAMSGMNVYFWISVALQAFPSASIGPTGTPMTMLLTGVLSLLSILLRERV